MEHLECCGTCDFYNGHSRCANEDSRHYGFVMVHTDGCPEYLENEKKVNKYELLRLSENRR